MERTLILLKPDAVQRGLAGTIISRFERKGLKIAAMKLMQITPELAAQHYEAHKERPFYPGLVAFMTKSPVVALVLQGNDAIAVCRKLMGATFGADADPGTIRGDFGRSSLHWRWHSRWTNPTYLTRAGWPCEHGCCRRRRRISKLRFRLSFVGAA